MAHGVQITTSMNAWPYVCDWNGDGRKDLLCGQEGLSSSSNVFVYLNQGTNAAPVFNDSTPVLNAGSPFPQWRTVPLYLDLDNDAKKDLILGEWYSDVRFYKNYGTNMSPSFNGFEYLVLPDSSSYSNGNPPRVTFSDWDGDGDLDMITCDYYGGVYLRRNITPTGVTEIGQSIRGNLILSSTPNPTAGPCRLRVRVANPCFIQVDAFSTAGAHVAALYRGNAAAGDHFFDWSTRGLPDGVYFIRCAAGKDIINQKITLAR